jgi:hypothetical protein
MEMAAYAAKDYRLESIIFVIDSHPLSTPEGETTGQQPFPLRFTVHNG